MARRRFIPIHDRGRVLTDVAVMLADGGESISDIGVLRHQSGALGPDADRGQHDEASPEEGGDALALN